jgi:hypothetical protein
VTVNLALAKNALFRNRPVRLFFGLTAHKEFLKYKDGMFAGFKKKTTTGADQDRLRAHARTCFDKKLTFRDLLLHHMYDLGDTTHNEDFAESADALHVCQQELVMPAKSKEVPPADDAGRANGAGVTYDP